MKISSGSAESGSIKALTKDNNEELSNNNTIDGSKDIN